ncbi:MAG: cation:proton antiporter [Helicobacteraceae bacterium]|nr:cation:proton antiporter [Helicobacteraceae bacterium]
MENLVLLAALSLLIMISPFASRLSGLPVAITEIALGALAAFFGFFAEGGELFDSIARVGFLYLMFLAGMEIDLREFGAIKRSLWRRIAAFLITLYALAIAIVFSFNLPPIYIAALPTISVGMIVVLIRARGRSEWLSFGMKLGVVGELISICVLTVLSGAVQLGGFNLEFLQTMATLLFVLICVWMFFYLSAALFWWFPKLKKLIMPEQDSLDEDVRIAFALFFALVAAMIYLGLEHVLGAFVAGMFIANYFNHKTDLPKKLGSLGFGFLTPIFFLHVGGTLDLRLILQADIALAAALIFFAMTAIRISASLIAFRGVFTALDRLRVGLSQSMPLTFLVAVATIGYEGELLNQNEYSSFIVASVAEVAVIMLFVKWLDKKTARYAKQ